MTVWVALLAVAVFLAAFRLSGIVRAALSAVEIARHSVRIMRDDSLDDGARETAVQAACLGLVGVFVSIAMRTLLVLLVSLALIWAAEQAGIAQSEAVVALLSRWDVILASTMAIWALYMLKVRLCRQG
jgi:hypothetical protein